MGILWPLWLILVSVLSSPGHQPTAMFLLTWSCCSLMDPGFMDILYLVPFQPSFLNMGQRL